MTRAVRLMIVHRNRLFRECLASVLSDDEQFHVMDLDHTDPGYLQSIEEEPPDVILVDINLPEQGAVTLIRFVREHVDRAMVVLLAYPDSEENLFECLTAGVHGCVPGESSLHDLQVAIEKVSQGETVCSPEVVFSMFSRLAQTARASHWRDRIESVDLTPRELEIVHLIADRLSNKEIARKLSLSLHTVKNHVHNIIEKLQVEDRFEAVEYARQRRWLKKPTLVASLEGNS